MNSSLGSKTEQSENQPGIAFEVLAGIDTGILLLDSSQHIVFVNKSWIESSISMPESYFRPGAPFESIVRVSAEQGAYGPGDIEEQIRERLGWISRGESYEFTRETRPGLFVSVKGRPLMNGGYGFIKLDVTESQLKVQEQEETINRLESILALRSLDFINQGISVFDRDLKLVSSNSKFCELLEFPPTFGKPGTTMEEMFLFNADRGEYGEGNPEEQVRQRIALAQKFEPHSFDRTRPDGVVIHVMGTPISEGAGGFITVYTDVTAERHREQESEDRLKKLQERMGLDALSGIDQGVLIIDKDLKVVAINDAFLDFYPVPDHLLMDGSPIGVSFELIERYYTEQGLYGDGDPEALLEERLTIVRNAQSYTAEFTLKDGRIVLDRGRALENGGYLFLDTDVTEKVVHERDQELRIAELENQMGLDTLDHVDIGIALIDKDLKVVRFNPAIGVLYDFPESLTQPGQPFESILRYLAGLGVYGQGDSDELVKELVKSLSGAWVQWRGDLNLPNGKIIDVTTHKLDGGGLCYLHRDVTEERQRQKRLEQTDPLTGLPNSEYLEQLTRKMILVAQKEHTELVGMRLKLDRFQLINEVYGANLGDDVFKAVVTRLKLAIDSDVVMGRGQGNELILMKSSSDARAAGDELVANLRDTMKEPFHVELDENVLDMPFTFSAGLACYPKDGTDMETLARKTGLALQYAAEEGDNYHYFDWKAARRRQTGESLKLENELRIAVQESQFTLYYQPQIDLQTGKLIGAEALIRWIRPNGDVVSPDTFIPIAEKSGLIIPIGKWVLDEACKQAKSWQDAGHSELKVSVNVSIVQFRQPDLVEQVRETLNRTALAAEWLELEVTESIVAEDIEHVVKTLDSLRALGISIAIDDFGTGYSSLSYLTRLPFDRLKIDQSFVRNEDRQNWLIVRSVVQLARSLGLEIIAEGVETLESMRLLRDVGCHIGQGYYFSRPMICADFESLLTQSSVVESIEFPKLVMDRIRLGLPTDYALSFINDGLDRYRQDNPEQDFIIRCDLSEKLIESFNFGELDAVIAIVRDANDPLLRDSWDIQPIWVCGKELQLEHSDTVPLVVHPEGCQYRQRIVRALSEAGRDWYVAFQSPDIAELQSAVEKSLGVSALTHPTKTDRMSVLNSEDGFLRLERIRVGLYVSDKTNEDKRAKVLNCLRESLGRSTLIDA